MEAAAAIGALSALAQPTRLAAFRALVAAGPAGIAAGEIARRLAVPANTMSAHLAVLSRAGLVAPRRAGRSVAYVVELDGLRALLAFLLRDCCGGSPERCAPLLDAALAPPASGRACRAAAAQGTAP